MSIAYGKRLAIMDQQQPNVGFRIRKLREKQGLSLRGLADRCKLSINAISRIERGENSPTVASLHVLANALDVPITAFFEDEHEQSTVFVKLEQRLQYQRNGLLMQSLGMGLHNQQIEPFLMNVQPGSGDLGEPITHPGQEFVYCVQGEVEYQIGSKSYHLETGDSLLFDSAQPHSFCNTTKFLAVILVVFQAANGGQVAYQRHLKT